MLGYGKECGDIERHAVAAIQVNFKDQSGSARNTISLHSVPDKYTPEQAWPLVVALYGYGNYVAVLRDLWKAVTNSLVG